MKFVLPLLFLSLPAFADSSPLGKWRTIDDETGKPKSIVEITEKDGMLEGKILKLFRDPKEDQNPKCTECEGEKKGQPIIGMTILWGLKKERHKWTGGHVLDPKNGKVYHATVKVVDDGKKLEMRGFIGGISLLGRTQTWERVEEPKK